MDSSRVFLASVHKNSITGITRDIGDVIAMVQRSTRVVHYPDEQEIDRKSLFITERTYRESAQYYRSVRSEIVAKIAK